MTLLIVLLTSVIVWLNRGLYDPSVPVLVGFFIYWSAQTVLDQDHFKEVKSYGFLIPWIFAILFFFRNDLLYVEAAKKPLLYGLRFCPFLILVADAVLKRMHPLRFRWVGLGLLCGMLLLVPFLSPEPFIDVFLSDRLAAHYLLLGSNPYSQIYPDIYKNHYDYHPGFLYWPGALYLQTASELILRDVRFALILSWIGCVFLLRNRGIYALMWLTLPFLQFALEQAWVDPMIAVGGALALYGLRKDQTIFWILGVVCAATVKQYGFIIGFFSVLYYIRMKGYHATLKPVLGMMLGFVLVLLPFVLWNWTDFVNMTMLNHLHATVREDSLNFTAFWLKTTGDELSGLMQLSFILLGFIAAIIHVFKNGAKRGLRVIPEAWAICFGFSFFFGKFAFCNYFLLLISFWLMAESEGDARDLIAQITPRANTEAHPSHTPRSA